MPRQKTLESKMTYRIKRSAKTVFLRKDFADLGGYDQVGRILRKLTHQEVLMNIGYGLYVPTRRSSITGAIIPVKSLPDLAKDAMARLGVETVPTRAEIAYNSWQSTQVPTGRMIGVKKRVTRKIARNGACIYYELHA